MRFCNKQCEKDAHKKEKSNKKEPEAENPSGQTEDLLKKQVEAEMKKEEKFKRYIIKSRGNVDIDKLISCGAGSKFEGYKNEMKDILMKLEDPTK